MDVVVKSRNAEIDGEFRNCAQDKLSRLVKLDAKAHRVEVQVDEQRNPRRSQQRVRVGLTYRSRGPVLRAEAAAADEHAALDLAISKLDNRLRRAADRRRVHHGSRTPVSVAAATAGSTDMGRVRAIMRPDGDG